MGAWCVKMKRNVTSNTKQNNAWSTKVTYSASGRRVAMLHGKMQTPSGYRRGSYFPNQRGSNESAHGGLYHNTKSQRLLKRKQMDQGGLKETQKNTNSVEEDGHIKEDRLRTVFTLSTIPNERTYVHEEDYLHAKSNSSEVKDSHSYLPPIDPQSKDNGKSISSYNKATYGPRSLSPRYETDKKDRQKRFYPYEQGRRSPRFSPDMLMGLPNVGMTCYANSLIQVLSQTPELLEHMEELSCEITSHRSHSSITHLFTKVLKELNSKSTSTKVVSSYSISNLLRAVCNRDYEFSIGEQNDCHLFMTTLFSLIKEEINDPDIGPLKMFEGLLQSQFSYQSCGHVEDSQEQMFGSLLIPLGKNIDNYSVYQGIQDLCKEEMFFEEELPCRKCLKENAAACESKRHRSQRYTIQKTKLKRLPSILVLQLGRFKEVSMFGRNTLAKLNKEISYPDKLSIGSSEGEVIYQLYGIVNHSGSLSGGHYTANVRRDISRHPNSPWFYCSDSHVHRLGDNGGRSSRSAYLLFYWKITSNEH